MVAILAVVGEIHSLFALGVAGHDAAIGLDDRLLEEFRWLLRPNPLPRFIEGVHQVENIGLTEAAAEVSGGGRVRDSRGSQRIEVNLVIAPQFEVLNALAARDDIEGNVQDMVGFVIRQMPLEQVKVAVDVLDEVDFLSQQKDGSDATGAEPADAIGIFVVDIGRRHHGDRPLGSG